jgi:hypothetical protein
MARRAFVLKVTALTSHIFSGATGYGLDAF